MRCYGSRVTGYALRVTGKDGIGLKAQGMLKNSEIGMQKSEKGPLIRDLERKNKIQNYSHKFSIVDAIPNIYVASNFTAHH